MPTLLQLRRGTTANHAAFTGAVGEVTVDTDKDTLVVHDGVTVGGFPLARIASAVAFTTLSTTGAITASGTGGATALNLTDVTSNVGINANPAAASDLYVTNQRNGSSIRFRTSNAGIGDTTTAVMSTTGLAVTGALSATGTITNTGASGVTNTVGGNTARMVATAGGAYFGSTTAADVTIQVNANTVGVFSTAGLAVTGALSATEGIGFPATQVASSDPNTLDDYREGSYTATATGMTTSPTGTVNYVKVGNMVTLDLPVITGTSNATTFTLTGMPAAIRPAGTRSVLVRTSDNGGALGLANAWVQADGTITFYKDAANTAFTASGAKAIGDNNVTYRV